MSQRDVYVILVELGGGVTTKQIKNRAKEKYPGRTLYLYVLNRLIKLERYGYVKRTKKEDGDYWETTGPEVFK